MILLALLLAVTSEIKVDLRLDNSDYVTGESVRCVVDIANSSPYEISVGEERSKDVFFVEVFRMSDMKQLPRISKHPFVADFKVFTGEGQKLETLLADHYPLSETSRYLARPVLVHNGVRFEGSPRVFDIVEGVKVGGAMQMFSGSKNLQREFELVYWSRDKTEHLLLKARDLGSSTRRWETRDLGKMLRIDKPTISVLGSGEVVVLHRYDRDNFVRTELWSLPKALEVRRRELVQDPETAGTQRVRELYKDKGVAPKENPWWKFW